MPFAIPTSDYSPVNWTFSTGSNLYSLIDELSPDDADYASNAINGFDDAPSGGCHLTKDAGIAISANLLVRARCFEAGGMPPTTDIVVHLRDNGGTVRQTWQQSLSNSGYTTFTLALDATGLSHFNSSSNPKLTFSTMSTTGTFTEIVRLSYARIEFTTASTIKRGKGAKFL